jgi:hypothetical protein
MFGIMSLARIAFTAAFAVMLSIDSRAEEACFRSEGVQCREDFKSFTAVSWSGDGYALAGQLRSSSNSGVGILRLSRDGQPLRTIPLALPDEKLLVDSGPTAIVHKLINLPNNVLVLVGNITISRPLPKVIGWLSAFDSNGTIWQRLLDDPSASTFLYGALYDAANDRIIVVGKRTLASDNGTCENWSQSYVQGLRGSDGQMLQPSIIQGTQDSIKSNRQGIYSITAGEKPGTFVVAGFSAVAHGGILGDATCKDSMMVAKLTQSDTSRWQLSQMNIIGSEKGGGNAFSIISAGHGAYVLAGQGTDERSGALAAQAYRVKLDPFTIERAVSFPYPEDGSDTAGGDRYRVIVPIEKGARVILAGSVSRGKTDPNLAMWRKTTTDLLNIDPPTIYSDAGNSDILDAAVSPQGRVLAVGKGGRNGATQTGWFGFIGGKPPSESAQPLSQHGTELSSLQFIDGAYSLPETSLSNDSVYHGSQIATGSHLDIALSISATKTIRISARAGSADIDIVLADATKRVVAYSNFKGSATEYIIETLKPGKYQLSLIAQTDVREFEIHFGPSQEISTSLLLQLQTLTEEERVKFAERLEAAGYAASSEPRIALGSEFARSVLAAQEGGAHSIGPRGIGSTLVNLIGRERRLAGETAAARATVKHDDKRGEALDAARRKLDCKPLPDSNKAQCEIVEKDAKGRVITKAIRGH